MKWIVCFFVILGLLMLAGCSELTEFRFQSYEQAAQSDSFSGWLPGVLPVSASNIRSAMHPETHQVWLVFDFPAEALDAFAATCSAVSFDQVELPDSSPRWWDEQALRDPWNAFYVCQDAGSLGYLAVMGSGEQAYYWSYR